MFWHPWLTLDRKIREVLAERMERGATNELDRRLMALIEQQRALSARAGSRDA